MAFYPASRDLPYRHKERDERETSANSCLLFWSRHRPETWMYLSSLKLVWQLCSRATTVATVFLWDYELAAMRQYYLLTYCWICNSTQIWGQVFKYCDKSGLSFDDSVKSVWSKLSNCKIKELSGPQKTVLHCFASGKDTFACFHTGYGKSLYMVNTFHLNNPKPEVLYSFHLEISSS